MSIGFPRPAQKPVPTGLAIVCIVGTVLAVALNFVPLVAAQRIPAAHWGASFETQDFSEWTWWPRRGGLVRVVNAIRAGVPPHRGAMVAQVQAPQGAPPAPGVESTLYKEWALGAPETEWFDDAGHPLARLPGDSVAGSYSAWFYLPRDYVSAGGRWGALMQFGESWVDGSGTWRSAPQWWLDLSRPDWKQAQRAGLPVTRPVMHLDHERSSYRGYRPRLIPVPLDRWFEIRAVVVPHVRIDWYLDGHLIGRSLQRAYPVGPSHAHPAGWTLGVGQYGGAGPLYVDDVRFIPGLPAAVADASRTPASNSRPRRRARR